MPPLVCWLVSSPEFGYASSLIWILQSNFLPGSYLDLSCLFIAPPTFYLAPRVIIFELFASMLVEGEKIRYYEGG